MEERMKRELDNYITGHWGEDQVQEHEMRQTWEEMVEEFSRMNGYPQPSEPAIIGIDPAIIALRLHLMLEELGELSRAMNERDIVKFSDSVCDMLYVVIGTGIAAGIGPILDELFREVHRSNMTKDPHTMPGHRGAIKGERYEPPDLGPIIDDYADAIKKINSVVDND